MEDTKRKHRSCNQSIFSHSWNEWQG